LFDEKAQLKNSHATVPLKKKNSGEYPPPHNFCLVYYSNESPHHRKVILNALFYSTSKTGSRSLMSILKTLAILAQEAFGRFSVKERNKMFFSI